MEPPDRVLELLLRPEESAKQDADDGRDQLVDGVGEPTLQTHRHADTQTRKTQRDYDAAPLLLAARCGWRNTRARREPPSSNHLANNAN